MGVAKKQLPKTVGQTNICQSLPKTFLPKNAFANTIFANKSFLPKKRLPTKVFENTFCQKSVYRVGPPPPQQGGRMFETRPPPRQPKLGFHVVPLQLLWNFAPYHGEVGYLMSQRDEIRLASNRRAAIRPRWFLCPYMLYRSRFFSEIQGNLESKFWPGGPEF